MKTVLFRSPFPLRRKWKDLYQGMQQSPFQSWYLNRLWFLVYGLKGKRRTFKPCFYLFVDEERNNECIIPVLVNRRKKILANFSHFGPLDYYDILCRNIDVVFLKDCLKSLFEKYPGYLMVFENVNEQSILYKLLDEYEKTAAPCVRIEFRSSIYDDYFGSLSKHQRQNIRTAYNKLKKANLNFSVVKYDAKNSIPRDVKKKCMKIYETRCAMKNGQRQGVLARIVAAKERHTNLINLMVRKAGSAVFVFFVESEPAAYLVCFYDEHRPIVYVPRLAVNVNFMKYDAGILLLNESIKCLLEERIAVVDLTRGDEPYKYAMGGVTHYNYCYKSSCN